jgi:hypothetical protein
MAQGWLVRVEVRRKKIAVGGNKAAAGCSHDPNAANNGRIIQINEPHLIRTSP